MHVPGTVSDASAGAGLCYRNKWWLLPFGPVLEAVEPLFCGLCAHSVAGQGSGLSRAWGDSQPCSWSLELRLAEDTVHPSFLLSISCDTETFQICEARKRKKEKSLARLLLKSYVCLCSRNLVVYAQVPLGLKHWRCGKLAHSPGPRAVNLSCPAHW